MSRNRSGVVERRGVKSGGGVREEGRNSGGDGGRKEETAWKVVKKGWQEDEAEMVVEKE